MQEPDKLIWSKLKCYAQVINILQNLTEVHGKDDPLKDAQVRVPRALSEAWEVCALGAGSASKLLALSPELIFPTNYRIPNNAQQPARQGAVSLCASLSSF